MNSDFIVAVHALVYLNHKADIISSEALAQNICTNAARVRKVMAPLKRAGFVATREGNVGGYRFVGDPAQVSLRGVADALDIRFVQSSWHSGHEDMECLVASGMAGIMDTIFEDLDARCRERLDEIFIADIDTDIFGISDDLSNSAGDILSVLSSADALSSTSTTDTAASNTAPATLPTT